MASAIKEHDSKKFLLYLDIEEIVDGLADSTSAAVEKKTSPALSSREPPKGGTSSANTRNIFRTLMPQVIKSLKPILERQLVKAVEDIEDKQTISPLALCTLSQVKRKGQLAEVSIQGDGGRPYTFTMARTSRRIWKVVRINMDLLDFVQKSRQAEK
jgi:hypothetical protein